MARRALLTAMSQEDYMRAVVGYDALSIPLRAFFTPGFFFFQAEDGIRHRDVTGVQTCALPISCAPSGRCDRASTRAPGPRHGSRVRRRSEERRVGKECRCRWGPRHYKRKT